MVDRRFNPAAAAARARGLAPPSMVSRIVPGAVFTIRDELAVLPEDRLGGVRSEHETRPVIVVQAPELNRSGSTKTITVIPCSASRTSVAACDIRLPEGEPGFDKDGVVAFVSLLQPVLKSDLLDWMGQIRDSSLDLIRAQALANLALLKTPAVELPARASATPAPTAQG